MLKRIASIGLFMCAAVSLQPAFAAADPTVHEIYTAAQSGNLTQARQMMDRVLQDHPNSGKAHYVSAELYARSRNYPQSQAELATAERLAPGLPFEKPEAVRELRAQLAAANNPPARVWSAPSPVAPGSPHFPLGALVILLVIGGIVVALIMRRRRAAMMTPYAPQQMGPGGAYYPGGPAAPPMGGGVGSGLAGGLASGLAMGAGLVAGEELAHHFLDGDRRGSASQNLPPSDSLADNNSLNSDMGGSDFGASDSDSWDDGSSVGGDMGGGGDDWS